MPTLTDEEIVDVFQRLNIASQDERDKFLKLSEPGVTDDFTVDSPEREKPAEILFTAKCNA